MKLMVPGQGKGGAIAIDPPPFDIRPYLYKSTLGGGGFRLGDDDVGDSQLAIEAFSSWYRFMLATPVALLFDSMATTARARTRGVGDA